MDAYRSNQDIIFLRNKICNQRSFLSIANVAKFINLKNRHEINNWIISLSNCLFLYNGVYSLVLNLSICDVIVSQKGSNGDEKLHFFGLDYNFTRSLCGKYIFGQRCKYALHVIDRYLTASTPRHKPVKM